MTILITGGSRNLGFELKKTFKDCLCPTYEELDITNKIKVNQYFQNHEITTIIHTVAKTKIRFMIYYMSQIDDKIRNYYRKFLKREPDEEGLSIFLTKYHNGLSLEDIHNEIKYSEEFEILKMKKFEKSFF